MVPLRACIAALAVASLSIFLQGCGKAAEEPKGTWSANKQYAENVISKAGPLEANDRKIATDIQKLQKLISRGDEANFAKVAVFQDLKLAKKELASAKKEKGQQPKELKERVHRLEKKLSDTEASNKKASHKAFHAAQKLKDEAGIERNKEAKKEEGIEQKEKKAEKKKKAEEKDEVAKATKERKKAQEEAERRKRQEEKAAEEMKLQALKKEREEKAAEAKKQEALRKEQEAKAAQEKKQASEEKKQKVNKKEHKKEQEAKAAQQKKQASEEKKQKVSKKEAHSMSDGMDRSESNSKKAQHVEADAVTKKFLSLNAGVGGPRLQLSPLLFSCGMVSLFIISFFGLFVGIRRLARKSQQGRDMFMQVPTEENLEEELEEEEEVDQEFNGME